MAVLGPPSVDGGRPPRGDHAADHNFAPWPRFPRSTMVAGAATL